MAAAILSSCCDDALSAVLRIAKNVGDMSKKTAEEELMGHLGVVHACCRGAADILGNRISENSAIEGDNEDGVISVVSTGRDSIVAKTGDSLVETKLLCLRDTVASTLLDLYDLLQGDNATSILAVRTGDNYATKVNIGSCRVTMTPDVAALWLRVFEALAIHRSWLKDPSVGKQFFSANKRQSTNSTARCAKRVIERFGSRLTEITPKGESYANALYWERYDLPPCASSDRGMIQYGFFAKEYAHSSMRSIIHAKTDCGTQSFFVSCFNRIVMLCGHEFESIRQDAVHTFNKVQKISYFLFFLVAYFCCRYQDMVGALKTSFKF